MSADQGRDLAESYGLDLVEVAPEARPPVCKILDYGKFKYDQSKKKSASAKTKVEIKTLRLRPSTDTHDLDNKMRKAIEFLEKGNKVRLTIRMRGREHHYPERWVEHLTGIVDQLCERYEPELRITQRPSREGRAISAQVENLA